MGGRDDASPHKETPGLNMLNLFVAGCFFLSGAAGLVYEVIWVRLIDKVIGGAPFAVATVLSVFMAGLALGSYLSGRFVDRIHRRSTLLALYGAMEIGIGACALLVPVLIRAVQPVFGLYTTGFWIISGVIPWWPLPAVPSF